MSPAAAPSRSAPPPAPLSRAMTAGEAFAAIAGTALAQVAANQRQARAAPTPESLHQLRVSLRGLRTVLTLFKPAVADDRFAAIRRELKWLGRELDAVRDLDVFIDETFRPAEAALDGDAGPPPLGRWLTDARARACDQAVKALASRRARALPLLTGSWIETGAWRASADLRKARDRPAPAFAAKVLGRLRRKIRLAPRRLTRMHPAERHRLRIAVKTLRYGTEYFAPLLPPRRTARYVAGLRGLQDALGGLNDITVARRTASAIAAPADALAAGFAIGLRAAETETLLRAAARQHRRLRDSRPPW